MLSFLNIDDLFYDFSRITIWKNNKFIRRKPWKNTFIVKKKGFQQNIDDSRIFFNFYNTLIFSIFPVVENKSNRF